MLHIGNHISGERYIDLHSATYADAHADDVAG